MRVLAHQAAPGGPSTRKRRGPARIGTTVLWPYDGAMVAWLGLVVATLAVAAPISEADRAIARQELKRGMTAVAGGAWEEAHEAFLRAYGLTSDPRVLYNLAAAQAETNRLIEAIASYQAVLGRADRAWLTPRRAQIEASVARLERRLGSVTLRFQGAPAGAELLLDDRPARLNSPLVVNPGPHRAQLSHGSAPLAAAQWQLAEGAVVEISLAEVKAEGSLVQAEVPRPMVPPLVPPTSAPESEPPSSERAFSGPVLWLAVGVLAAAGATLTIAALSSGGEPYAGSTGVRIHASGQ